MESSSLQEREIRAVRNQALFRAVNEKIMAMNAAFSELTESFAICCECADTSCIEIIRIGPDEYSAVRAEPRHFAVRPDHVYPELEVVVRESATYVVVEKIRSAAKLAEEFAE